MPNRNAHGLARHGRRLIAAGVALTVGLAASLLFTTTAAGATSYSIWGDSVTPRTAVAADTKPVELGVRFRTARSGVITAVRYYKNYSAQGSAQGTLWSSGGQQLAKASFSSTTGQGWKVATLSSPVQIAAGQTFVASYTAPRGAYFSDQNTLGGSQQVVTQDLTALSGVYSYSLGFPSSTYKDSNYYADVLFTPGSVTAAPPTTSTSTTRPPTTSAPASTTATATPPPATQLGCAGKPSACGYPDSTNTGVPIGKSLIAVPGQATSGPGWHYDSRGWISVDGNGAVLDGITTTASIDVVTSNATIRNSRLTVAGEGWAIALRHTSNVTIQNNEISGPAKTGASRLMVGIKDIYGDSAGLKVIGNEIWNASTGIQIESGTIQDNYIHDPGYKAGDHLNGITSNGGSSSLVIRHNTVFNDSTQTDAISLFQDFGAQRNRTIDNNLLAGGGYTLYAGANPGKESTATAISVTNNRFSRKYFPNGGYYGPSTAYTSGGGNTWSGNTWDDSGKTINGG